ncbi:MAG: hypothetical protein GAK36_00236 [Pseudomonas sp.]|nr:MAG: hypothetical protein GAK36_00236 [Pseudomonas sp.]
MPQGLQVLGENSNVVVDTNLNYAKFLGSLETGGVNGSLSDSRISSGSPFAIVLPLPYSPPAGKFGLEPQITFSENSVSWTYNKFNTMVSSGVPLPVIITYGVF